MRTHHWVLRGQALSYSYTDPEGNTRHSFPIEDVVMDVVLPSDETFEPPPWVRYGIETKGWRVVSRELTDSGLVYHGEADWRAIADRLALALLGDDDEANRSALDHYQIAVTEVELARGQEASDS